MESRAEKVDKAWRNSYSIANSRSIVCGNMICHKCKKKIQGNYLIQDRQNFLLRGNEHDESYLFHRKCSESNKAWAEFDKQQKDYREAEKIRASRIEEVVGLIKRYGLYLGDLAEHMNNS